MLLGRLRWRACLCLLAAHLVRAAPRQRGQVWRGGLAHLGGRPASDADVADRGRARAACPALLLHARMTDASVWQGAVLHPTEGGAAGDIRRSLRAGNA